MGPRKAPEILFEAGCDQLCSVALPAVSLLHLISRAIGAPGVDRVRRVACQNSSAASVGGFAQRIATGSAQPRAQLVRR